MAMNKISKNDVHWIKKAPVKNCGNCIHRKDRMVKPYPTQTREYKEGNLCGLYGWRTLANAICDAWKKGEEDGPACKTADTD